MMAYLTYTLLYTADDGHSSFKTVSVDTPHDGSFLGKISEAFAVKKLWYRHSLPGTYEWHTAPQNQFIVYLSGRAKIETSSGETRFFKTGDILYATDTTGRGHRSTILEEGRSLIIAAE